MSASRSRIARTIVLALGGMAAAFAVYLWCLPAFGTATYQYQGKAAQTTALPIRVSSEADRMDVSFTMSLRPIHFRTYLVVPDDCVERLAINGQVVDGRIANFCDYTAGRSLNLGPYLQTGRNDVQVVLRDGGGLGGLRMGVSFVDPLLLLLAVVFTALAVVAGFAAARLPAPPLDRGLVIVALTGVALRLLYALGTYYTVRGHDTDAHIEYIQYVAANLRIPSAGGGWEFHQPPLYYFITGLYLRWASWLGQSLESSLRTIQAFSLLASVGSFLIALWAGTMLFDRTHQRARLLLYGMLVCSLPSLVFMAARISNDPLYELLSFTAFALLVLWWKRGGAREWYALLAAVCLAITTKSSGALLLPLVLICLFLRKGLSWPSKVRQAALSLGIVLLLAGAVPAWRVLTDPAASHLLTMNIAGTNQRLVVETTARNLLTFNPIGMLNRPLNDPWQDGQRRQNFWEYLFRSAYFGEFGYSGRLRFLEQLIVASGLLGLVLAVAGLASEWRGDSRRWLPLFVTCGALLAAALGLRLKYALAPIQDFRYVTLLALPMTCLSVQGAFAFSPLSRRPGVIVLAGLAGLCTLFVVLVLFVA